MADNSTTGPLDLQKAVDADNARTYLKTTLAGDIDALNAAFNTTTGHDHDGTDSKLMGGVTAWTPDLQFGGAKVGITYSTQLGWYIKIGNLVIGGCNIVLTSKGSSVGAATIAGLPFACSATYQGGAAPALWANLAVGFAVSLVGLVTNAAQSIQLFKTGGVSYAAVADTDLTDTTQVVMTFVYPSS